MNFASLHMLLGANGWYHFLLKAFRQNAGYENVAGLINRGFKKISGIGSASSRAAIAKVIFKRDGTMQMFIHPSRQLVFHLPF